MKKIILIGLIVAFLILAGCQKETTFSKFEQTWDKAQQEKENRVITFEITPDPVTVEINAHTPEAPAEFMDKIIHIKNVGDYAENIQLHLPSGYPENYPRIGFRGSAKEGEEIIMTQTVNIVDPGETVKFSLGITAYNSPPGDYELKGYLCADSCEKYKKDFTVNVKII